MVYFLSIVSWVGLGLGPGSYGYPVPFFASPRVRVHFFMSESLTESAVSAAQERMHARTCK